jgi:hypothetical protein
MNIRQSQLQILLYFAYIAEDVGNLILETDDVSLREDYLDVFLVELL